jgi:hypothetical protein
VTYRHFEQSFPVGHLQIIVYDHTYNVRNFWSSLLFASIQSAKEYGAEVLSFKRSKNTAVWVQFEKLWVVQLATILCNFINTNIFIIFISNNLSAELYLTYCLKRPAIIGACRFESFWFPTLYMNPIIERWLSFPIFKLSLTLKYLGKTVIFCISWDKENVLLQCRWISQALTRFWRCDAYSLNKTLLTFVS